MSFPKPNAKTQRELDEEHNAKQNCPHPRGAVVTETRNIGSESRDYCNCCESYL